MVFDHLVHLTADILAPDGPLPAREVNVDVAIGPAIDWMLAGLPQMCGAMVHAALVTPVGLRLTGPDERHLVLARSAETPGTVTVIARNDLADNQVISDATAFLRWATKRTAWRSATTVIGD